METFIMENLILLITVIASLGGAWKIVQYKVNQNKTDLCKLEERVEKIESQRGKFWTYINNQEVKTAVMEEKIINLEQGQNRIEKKLEEISKELHQISKNGNKK